MNSDKYFILVAPLCSFLLGVAFCFFRLVLKGRDYFIWIAGGYISQSIALTAQTLMTNSELSRTTLFSGTVYLAGFWFMTKGLAQRSGGSAHPVVGALVGVFSLAGLFYFSHIEENLWLRMLLLNAGIGIILSLGVIPAFKKAHRVNDFFEWSVFILYFSLLLYSILRLLIILIFVDEIIYQDLISSSVWLYTLVVYMVLGFLLAIAVLAVSVKDAVSIVKFERDRDPLTSLLNRRALDEICSDGLGGGKSPSWAVLMCDIDYFKKINDEHGHNCGDQILKLLAKIIQKNIRSSDFGIRYGGEEFVVLLENGSIAVAKLVAERIRLQLAEESFLIMGSHVTASFGLAFARSTAEVVQALECADRLMYKSKMSGRNRVSVEE